MKYWLFTITLFSLSLQPAYAQSSNELSAQIETALKKNDYVSALQTAKTLYNQSLSENNFAAAGQAAFTQAKILTLTGKHLDAAQAYTTCFEQYTTQNQTAQALHCKFESGNAYLTGAKLGLGVRTLEDTEKALTKIGQEKSGLAALVYLKLASQSLPPKLDGSNRARGQRNNSIVYAEQAMTALTANGKEKSNLYLSALFSKGIALEDGEKYEQAAAVFSKAVELSKSLPNINRDTLRNAQTHLNITKAQSTKKKNSKTLTISDASGKDIVLKVKKKKRVKVPRINKNQIVDGARVKAKITLDADGKVANIEILESIPDKAYGEAFSKAVNTWTFTPPEGIAANDIPPFEYGMSFYVQRF